MIKAQINGVYIIARDMGPTPPTPLQSSNPNGQCIFLRLLIKRYILISWWQISCIKDIHFIISRYIFLNYVLTQLSAYLCSMIESNSWAKKNVIELFNTFLRGLFFVLPNYNMLNRKKLSSKYTFYARHFKAIFFILGVRGKATKSRGT